MNTANLQLEGLVMAMALMHQLLVSKGLVGTDEVDRVLATAEESALGDYRVEDLTPANRDAIVFPVRLLRLANNMAGGREVPPFSELARMVGETKQPYNDQR
ncbi:MAG: hypothetical protein EOP24_18775 [Hyphomicrobiales bacterium]|jgi:hypothetical protein|nr:MAG: hypothetical protein EOP24_18775 [Hyphomicrobiales bacterium]